MVKRFRALKNPVVQVRPNLARTPPILLAIAATTNASAGFLYGNWIHGVSILLMSAGWLLLVIVHRSQVRAAAQLLDELLPYEDVRRRPGGFELHRGPTPPA